MHKRIQLLLMQPVFEEVQSAFIRYGIEVVAWEDVPIAVQKLAHKQGKDPLPDGELCFCLQTIVHVFKQCTWLHWYTRLMHQELKAVVCSKTSFTGGQDLHFHGCTTNQAS